MKPAITALLIVLLLATPALAKKVDVSQPAPEGLFVPTVYTVTVDPSGALHPWVNATGGTALPGGDDVISQITWPFDFKVYDNLYLAGVDMIDVNTNGSVHFDQGGPRTLWVNCGDAPSTIDGEWVAPLGDDLISDQMFWTVVGTAPNRVLAIEWVGSIEYSAGPGVFDLEVLCYETTNVIAAQVQIVVQGAFLSDGVVGINAGDGVRGQEVFCAAAGPLPSLMFDVEFLPPSPVSVGSETWGGVKALYR